MRKRVNVKRKTIHFNFQDIADLRGIEIKSVYKAIEMRMLDKDSLGSVWRYALRVNRGPVKAMLQFLRELDERLGNIPLRY